MHKTKTFRTKLWLCFVLFAGVIFGLLWLMQAVFLQTFYNGMLEKNTRQAARKIVSAAGSAELTDLIDTLSNENSLLVFITEKDGTILYSSDSYKSYYHAPETGKSDEENPYRQGQTMNWQAGNYRNLPDGYDDFLERLKSDSDGDIAYRSETQFICGAYIELEGGIPAVLYTSAAFGAVGAAVSIIRTQLILVTLLSLVIAFVIAWFLARRFSVPVKELSRQAESLAEDQYETQFEKGFCSELDALSNSLDETAKKLAKARDYQKQLLANVSHDLRTPLTMIKGYAEIIRDVSWKDETQRNADTGIIIREADRLSALVNEILEYTRLQEGEMKEPFSELDFGILVKEVTGQFEPLLIREGIHLETKIADACIVMGDAALLKRAVYNLIDNAVRHMGDDRRITISVSRTDSVLLAVTDYGTGIDEEELPYIWEKYYTARQRQNKGVSGLGLAIVKEIVGMHGAQCGVRSSKGNGSCFWISLPVL